LYNWTGDEYKTQARVRMIMDTMYGPGVEGLCGNDDAGQMSAWYIFSALGFYPVTPGSNEYALGSPLVKKATLNLENGKTLVIATENQSKENVYVSKLTINGKEIKRNYILHDEIMNGGEFVFTMSNQPNQ
jgi:putative alpha-1,2-mannosidase